MRKRTSPALERRAGNKNRRSTIKWYQSQPPNATPLCLSRRGAAKPYFLQRLRCGELALSKRVKASRHFLRVPRAIAIDVAVLSWAEREGATLVHVEDWETGLVYEATLTTIQRKGLSLDRGFGEQVALPLAHWTRSDKAQEALF
ncbi:MAG: hypothetical protein GTO55_11805 [Armatimonadetes bacterium]|nr:hypothetical protein [Armatimonadota bacterium]NIM24896.1 hypothetical protein [Armatimonadota bacterium]NIM68787.1 hypothetical protein [Armatimonadota bacterium]NIN06982.1 hypothetical protein [Armatimonadota bacterium]NIO98886.1 hypothetical protein [Armatimonadota bacterium]